MNQNTKEVKNERVFLITTTRLVVIKKSSFLTSCVFWFVFLNASSRHCFRFVLCLMHFCDTPRSLPGWSHSLTVHARIISCSWSFCLLYETALPRANSTNSPKDSGNYSVCSVITVWNLFFSFCVVRVIWCSCCSRLVQVFFLDSVHLCWCWNVVFSKQHCSPLSF